MPFLTLPDFKPDIRDQRFQQMLDQDTAIVAMVEAEAIAIIRQYLYCVYDCDNIFNKTGAARSMIALIWVKRIALYILHRRLPNAMIPPHIQKDYDDTISYLKILMKGEMKTDLPLIQVDANNDGVTDEPTTLFKWGARRERTHDVFGYDTNSF
jgi:phage gp36-like protein